MRVFMNTRASVYSHQSIAYVSTYVQEFVDRRTYFNYNFIVNSNLVAFKRVCWRFLWKLGVMNTFYSFLVKRNSLKKSFFPIKIFFPNHLSSSWSQITFDGNPIALFCLALTNSNYLPVCLL